MNPENVPVATGTYNDRKLFDTMKILISNDDGYQAPGIVALYDAPKDVADVEVVAPEQNNSAKSNALTLHSPLSVTRAANGFRYINGTPADCVHIALTGLLGYRPDLVVSGINNGANMGDDTIYSGTVGAAMEGYLFGIPAIAFSQVEKGWGEIEAGPPKGGGRGPQKKPQHPGGSPPGGPPPRARPTRPRAQVFDVTGTKKREPFKAPSFLAFYFSGLVSQYRQR